MRSGKKPYQRKRTQTNQTQGNPKMSKPTLKVRGILFDLDGTIVDSKEAYLEAAKTAFQALGQKAPSTQTALEIPKRLEQNQPIDDIIKADTQQFLGVYLKTYYAITEKKTKPIPHVASTLWILQQKAKLAVITMRYVPKAAVLRELERFSLAKYFTHVITALDTHKPKPSPEALIQAVKTMDVQICDCLIVGDSVADIKAGKAVGARTVAVLSGLFSREELAKERPDFILKDVTELPSYIQ